ncbi:MAG: hypothetical protein ACOCSD_06980 [Halolamina sp.]
MADFDAEEGDRVEVTYREDGRIHSRFCGRVRDIQSRPGPVADVAVIEIPFGVGATTLRVRAHEVEIEVVADDE